MTQEEKAKAYDDALERASKLRVQNPFDTVSQMMEHVFPELVEQEDERIKKELISFVNNDGWKFTKLTKEEKESWINWLKKQGVQEPIDNVVHKFNIGDWITDGYLHCKISDILDDRYIVNTNFFAKRSAIPFKWEDYYHIWTIQDARDGDVIVNGSNIFIFHFLNDTRLMGYCHINTDDGKFYDDLGKYTCFCLIDAVVTPATKEQRDLLFTKMHEAGYEWDDDKKKLKEIKKTSKWTEEDERFLDDVDFTLFQYKDMPKERYWKIINWIKSLKQRMEEQQ